LRRSPDQRRREIDCGVITRCDIAISKRGKVEKVLLSVSTKSNCLERAFSEKANFVRVKFESDCWDDHAKKRCDQAHRQIMQQGLCTTRGGVYHFEYYGGKETGKDSTDIFVAGVGWGDKHSRLGWKL
jgi:hypothetical protein